MKKLTLPLPTQEMLPAILLCIYIIKCLNTYPGTADGFVAFGLILATVFYHYRVKDKDLKALEARFHAYEEKNKALDKEIELIRSRLSMNALTKTVIK